MTAWAAGWEDGTSADAFGVFRFIFEKEKSIVKILMIGNLMTFIGRFEGVSARLNNSPQPSDGVGRRSEPVFSRNSQKIERDKATTPANMLAAQLCERLTVPGIYSFPFTPGPGKVRVFSPGNMHVNDLSGDRFVSIKNGVIAEHGCIATTPERLLRRQLILPFGTWRSAHHRSFVQCCSRGLSEQHPGKADGGFGGELVARKVHDCDKRLPQGLACV